MHYDVHVPSEAGSVGLVRRAVTSVSATCGDQVAEKVGLIFTELVTNAVRHAALGPQDRIDVELTISADGVHGSVTDPGCGFEIDRRGPSPHQDGGYGLFIVARLARQWGVERSAQGTKVWFEL